MAFAPTEISLQVADLLDSKMDEVTSMLIEQFLAEYPQSASLTLGRSTLGRWSEKEMELLEASLRGDEVSLRASSMYTGDVNATVSPYIAPMVTLVETWMFISRTLAPFVWRHFAQEPLDAQAALEALEGATMEIIRNVVRRFLDTQLVPGSLTREWLWGGVPAIGAQSQVKRAEGSTLDRGATAAMRPGLTRREREIVKLVADGRTNGEIAGELAISQSSVKNHLSRIFDKLNVNTRCELTRVAIETGLV